jgi:uncharacterized RDD family membrane protein YckC
MLSASGIRRKPMKENAHVSEQPAPLWRRLLALLYELLAVAAILFVVTMAGLLVTHNQLDHTAAGFRIALLLAVEAYFVISWIRGGQSLGMRAWRLYLRDEAGGTPDLTRAILRFTILASPLLLLALALVAGPVTGMVAPLAAWIVDLSVAAFDRRRRALHDILAGTWIAYRPPATRHG